MSEALPNPLVPAEVDLRGLKYMPLLGGQLFGSNFDLDANDAEFRLGLKLWWIAWNQVPAASLPKEDHRLRKLAGLDEAPVKWRKLRERALHGFVECSDGRLYHAIVAAQALIAWDSRMEDREERENAAERQRRSRAERRRMFAELRAAGQSPKWDIGKDELRELHAKHVTRTVTQPVTVTGAPPVTGGVTPLVTGTATAKTGRDGTGIEIQERATASLPLSLAPDDEPPEDPADDDPPPEANGHDPSPGGSACRAMRQAGFPDTNPGDPRLLALLEQGATEAELVDAAQSALRSTPAKGWGWVLKAVEGRRRDAAAIALAPAPAATPWTERRSEVVQRGCELGIGPWDEPAWGLGTGPSWPEYRRQVIAADARRQGETA